MSEPLRIGLIGAGMVSRHHLIAWAAIPDLAKVVVVADPSHDNAARRASEFGIPRTCADAAAMLAGTELDAVDIAAPHNGAGFTVFASFAAHGHPAAQIDRLEILGDKGAIRLDGPRLTCACASPAEQVYDLAAEYQGAYNRTIAHFVTSLRDDTPFETAPQDNLSTLQLVEDCYRLSGWEASR